MEKPRCKYDIYALQIENNNLSAEIKRLRDALERIVSERRGSSFESFIVAILDIAKQALKGRE